VTPPVVIVLQVPSAEHGVSVKCRPSTQVRTALLED
jgi:hypothetical protein